MKIVQFSTSSLVVGCGFKVEGSKSTWTVTVLSIEVFWIHIRDVAYDCFSQFTLFGHILNYTAIFLRCFGARPPVARSTSLFYPRIILNFFYLFLRSMTESDKRTKVNGFLSSLSSNFFIAFINGSSVFQACLL
jgi:hypothetical protein